MAKYQSPHHLRSEACPEFKPADTYTGGGGHRAAARHQRGQLRTATRMTRPFIV